MPLRKVRYLACNAAARWAILAIGRSRDAQPRIYAGGSCCAVAVNPGKRFEGKLLASMRGAGMFAMRIPDKLYLAGGRIASEETPADFIASYAQCYDGKLRQYLIEAKACSKNRIMYSQLKEHQERALLEFDALHEDSHGYVAVNYYDPVSISRLDVCFLIPISTWVSMRDAEGAMKSLSHDECLSADGAVICPKVGGGMYDLKRLLGGHDGG